MKGKKWIKAVYPAAIVALIYLLVTVLRQLGIMNGYYNQVLMFAGINIMMTASLNLVNGPWEPTGRPSSPACCLNIRIPYLCFYWDFLRAAWRQWRPAC